MQEKYMLRCTNCKSVLELEVVFDGCDWDSVTGEGSGFDYQIQLSCPQMGCGRVYPIGRIKEERDFCENKEIQRPYK